MCGGLGDLLGGVASAPAAAGGSAGGMFAGLDVGTSTNSQPQSAPPSASAAPQSPLDALADLQGPSPSHLGIILDLAAPPVTQSSLGCVSAVFHTVLKGLHCDQQDTVFVQLYA